jgi:DNA-binding MurR/RpiR family transcriptional regulator
MFEDIIKKRYQFLTNNQKKVAQRLAAYGNNAAFLTVNQLADHLETSGATIVRLVRSLGYRGYPDWQRELQQLILNKVSPPEALEESMGKRKDRDIYSEIFDIEQQNLKKTRELNKNEIIGQVVDAIIKAKKVVVSGFRSSSAMAYLLYILLSNIRADCQFLEYESGSRASQLIHYGKGDLFICFSMLRYSQQTFANLALVKKSHCQTIAITDSSLSPFGQHADLVLLVENRSSTYFNFWASTMALIECIVTGVSLKDKKSLSNLKKVNQTLEEWNYLFL